jgi:hypothetical protein
MKRNIHARNAGKRGESAGSGGSPPKRVWGTRAVLLAGALGIVCAGLVPGCTSEDRREGKKEDTSAERYNHASQIWKTHGRMEALAKRMDRDRERIFTLKVKLKAETDEKERYRLMGAISALRNGIDEMNREFWKVSDGEEKRRDAETAKGEALPKKPDGEK